MSPITRALSGALLSGLFLFGLTGCPAQTGCTICTVGGVMSSSGTTSAAPASTLDLQMATSGTVKEVVVTLTNADGQSETLTYSGDKVSGINGSSVTSIADTELYDVEGKPPSRATVDVSFSNGKTVNYPLTIEAESSGTEPTAAVK